MAEEEAMGLANWDGGTDDDDDAVVVPPLFVVVVVVVVLLLVFFPLERCKVLLLFVKGNEDDASWVPFSKLFMLNFCL